MKPIAQTFFVKESPAPTGAAGIFITRLDIYFQSISSVNGIEVQIRPTINGVPDSSRLPFGSKTLDVGEVVVLEDFTTRVGIKASSNASVPSTFLFDTPVFVEANKLYAIVVIPLGGDPNYNIWTAVIGDKDVTTSNPIWSNKDTGDLFLSSNDLSWQPVINEDIKYELYCANFNVTSGTAYFTSPDEEWIEYNNPSSNFTPRETIVFSNGYYDLASLSISNINGTFNIGDQVNQGAVSGLVYSATTSLVKVSNTTGIFSISDGLDNNTKIIKDGVATVNATVTAVSQNTITDSTTTITVPDVSMYATNQIIHISSVNRSLTDVVKINSINSGNKTLIVNTAIRFSDVSALIGRVKYDGALKGQFSGGTYYSGTDNNIYYGIIDDSTAAGVMTLNGVSNVQMIGTSSGASANFIGPHDPVYNSITPDFSFVATSNTGVAFSFRGLENNNNLTVDSSYQNITPGSILELIDKERVALSRSNEIVNFAADNSVIFKVDMVQNNAKVSPVLDLIRTNLTYTYNIVPMLEEISGTYLNITDTGVVKAEVGHIIQQTSHTLTTSGTVHFANSSFIRLTNVDGKFINQTAFTNITNSNTGTVQTATEFNEAYDNGYYKVSRYMSKSVVLAPGQDSEDLKVYIAAYRPNATEVKMFAKLKSIFDNSNFSDRDWSPLAEQSDSALRSSPTNTQDKVELVYGLNSSINMFSGVTCNTTSVNVTCVDTSSLSNGNIIYLNSTVVANPFNVRKIVYVANSTTLIVDRTPTFVCASNGVLGLIPGLESTTSAFLYDGNDNIVRYCTTADAVYDGYIQFAMKIVPVSDSTALVPRVSDMRVIALQV